MSTQPLFSFPRRAILTLALSSLWTNPASAAIINVTGSCTLIKAIRSANGDPTETDCTDGDVTGTDTIILQNSSVHTLTTVYANLDGPNGLPPVSSSITIDGNHATITRASNFSFRFFHVNAAGGDLKLNNVTLSFGAATGNGGAILNAGTLNLGNTILKNNSATLNGGALMVLSGVATLQATTVVDNTSSYDGGGVAGEYGASLSLYNSTVKNNSAGGLGGGLYNSGGVNNSDSRLTLTDSTVSDNTCGGFANGGGGVFSFHATTTLNRTTISGNTSGGTGGGLGNSSATVTLNNSTVSANSAGAGGGIQSYSGVTTLNNCTLSGNNAVFGGSGIRLYSGSMTVSNTIIANSPGGNDCFVGGTSPSFSVAGVNFFGDASCIDPTALRGDPRLGPLANNGGATWTHSLNAGSPAIDHGDNARCAAVALAGVDQRGFARTSGAKCDVGAYEKDQSMFFVVPVPGGRTIIFNL